MADFREYVRDFESKKIALKSRYVHADARKLEDLICTIKMLLNLSVDARLTG